MYGLRFTADSGGASFREWQEQQYQSCPDDDFSDDPCPDEDEDNDE